LPAESAQQISPAAQSAASSHVKAVPPFAQPAAPSVGRHIVAIETCETQHTLASIDPTVQVVAPQATL
jgi:hypothetical protein